MKMMEMFYDVNGKVSMQRALYFLVTCCVLFLWVTFSLREGNFVSVNVDALYLILGLSGTKALQTFGEKKGNG